MEKADKKIKELENLIEHHKLNLPIVKQKVIEYLTSIQEHCEKCKYIYNEHSLGEELGLAMYSLTIEVNTGLTLRMLACTGDKEIKKLEVKLNELKTKKIN